MAQRSQGTIGGSGTLDWRQLAEAIVSALDDQASRERSMELHQERAAAPSLVSRVPEIDKQLAKATSWPITRPPPPSPKELSIMRFQLKAVDRPQLEKAITLPLSLRDIAAAFPPPSLKEFCTMRFILKTVDKWNAYQGIDTASLSLDYQNAYPGIDTASLSLDYHASVECSNHATDAGQVGKARVKREGGRTRQRRAAAIRKQASGLGSMAVCRCPGSRKHD